MHEVGRRGRKGAAMVSILLIGLTAGPATVEAQIVVKSEIAALARLPVIDSSSLRRVVGNLAGESGKLLARFVAPPRSLSIPAVTENLSYTSRVLPGIQEVAGASRIGRFSLITMRSFRDKIAGSVGDYRIGFFPEEKGRARSEAYENPEGFIEVTRENQDTRISEHFRLRDFLTRDQQAVWPKYLVLREPLIDKLELVILDLQDHGVPVRSVQVLSGFRPPIQPRTRRRERAGTRQPASIRRCRRYLYRQQWRQSDGRPEWRRQGQRPGHPGHPRRCGASRAGTSRSGWRNGLVPCQRRSRPLRPHRCPGKPRPLEQRKQTRFEQAISPELEEVTSFEEPR